MKRTKILELDRNVMKYIDMNQPWMIPVALFSTSPICAKLLDLFRISYLKIDKYSIIFLK